MRGRVVVLGRAVAEAAGLRRPRRVLLSGGSGVRDGGDENGDNDDGGDVDGRGRGRVDDGGGVVRERDALGDVCGCLRGRADVCWWWECECACVGHGPSPPVTVDRGWG